MKAEGNRRPRFGLRALVLGVGMAGPLGRIIEVL